MAKLEETLSRFFGGDDYGFNGGLLIVIAIGSYEIKRFVVKKDKK